MMNVTQSQPALVQPGNTSLDDGAYARAKFEVPILERVWRAVWESKWWVMAIMLAALVIGIIVTMLATPLYTATALIEISRQQANIAGVDGLEESDLSRDQEFYDTQYSLLAARSLAERVVREQNLAADDEFFETMGAPLESLDSGTAERQTRRDAQLRSERARAAEELLLNGISIQPVRGSSLVNVGFTSPDRALSTRIANAWVDQFIEATMARRFASTQDARSFLEGRLEEYRQRLEDSERRLVGYAADEGIVSLDETQDAEGNTQSRRTLASSDLETMNAALGEARAARIQAQSQLRITPETRQSFSDPALNGLRQRRAEVAAQRAQLLATFEPEYPTVQALTRQLEDLDSSIASEEARLRGQDASIRSDGRRAAREIYDAALQRERQLTSEVARLRGQLNAQNQASVQYNILQREVDTNRELYEALLQRYKEIGVAGVSANNIAIVDAAERPESSSYPSWPLNILLSLILGGAVAAAYVFARNQIDQTLRDPGDVRRLLGLAPLGTIPAMDTKNLLEDLQDPKSLASEAYISAGTNLSFLTEHGTPKSLLFTSTQPDEGKTTSSFAIANVLARTGKNVLLIDADMRNPSLHGMADIDNDVGFSDYLSGEDDLARLLHATERKGLSLMTAGPIPPNPAELLASHRLGDLIGALESRFDHIVIDGPPVLGIADVPLLANNVEGVIYTIEANRTKLRAMQTVLARLSNAHIFGAIVTKVDQRNSAYGYGYGYGYGYSYGGSDKRSAADEAAV